MESNVFSRFSCHASNPGERQPSSGILFLLNIDING